ncbi:MAG: hypothetical protein K1X88_14460 [Nannocystaceae bacterium]|nr:hypothetical protein [Nannocystaceae bacterium]
MPVPPRPPTFVLALLPWLACNRAPEPAPAAASAPQSKRERCDELVTQSLQAGVLAARGLAAGLEGGGVDEASLTQELAAQKQGMIEQCMAWPDEALDCMGAGALLRGDRCERILAEAFGEPVLPESVPAGPAPRWRASLPGEIGNLVGTQDGLVVIESVIESPAPDDPPVQLIALAQGTSRWKHGLPAQGAGLELVGDTVVVAVGDRVFALALADGSERWQTRLPALDGDDGGEVSIRAMTGDGETLAMVDDRGRIVRVNPAACASKTPPRGAPPCIGAGPPIAALGELAPEVITHGPGRTLALVDPQASVAVVVDDDATVRTTLAAHVTLSWAQRHGDALVVAADGDVVGLAPAQCSGTIAPATWPITPPPQWLRDTEIAALPDATAPAGCVLWHRPLVVSDATDPPFALAVGEHSDAWITSASGFTYALSPRDELWRSPTRAQSLAVATGRNLAIIGDTGSDDTVLTMMWLAAEDGRHLCHAPLGLAQGKLLLWSDAVLVRAGTEVIAGFERDLVAFDAEPEGCRG